MCGLHCWARFRRPVGELFFCNHRVHVCNFYGWDPVSWCSSRKLSAVNSGLDKSSFDETSRQGWGWIFLSTYPSLFVALYRTPSNRNIACRDRRRMNDSISKECINSCFKHHKREYFYFSRSLSIEVPAKLMIHNQVISALIFRTRLWLCYFSVAFWNVS